MIRVRSGATGFAGIPTIIPPSGENVAESVLATGSAPLVPSTPVNSDLSYMEADKLAIILEVAKSIDKEISVVWDYRDSENADKEAIVEATIAGEDHLQDYVWGISADYISDQEFNVIGQILAACELNYPDSGIEHDDVWGAFERGDFDITSDTSDVFAAMKGIELKGTFIYNTGENGDVAGSMDENSTPVKFLASVYGASETDVALLLNRLWTAEDEEEASTADLSDYWRRIPRDMLNGAKAVVDAFNNHLTDYYYSDIAIPVFVTVEQLIGADLDNISIVLDGSTDNWGVYDGVSGAYADIEQTFRKTDWQGELLLDEAKQGSRRYTMDEIAGLTDRAFTRIKEVR